MQTINRDHLMQKELKETKQSLKRLRNVLEETPGLTDAEKTLLRDRARVVIASHRTSVDEDGFEF